MTKHVYTWDSLSDFLREVDVPKPVNPASSTAWDSAHDKWCGGSREQAFDMARNGWSAGTKNMVQAMAQARPAVALPPSFTMDVAGAYPIAALAAAGDPCSMVNPDPLESRRKPIIRLAVNVWASCAYEPEEFTNYGAAVLSYIDAIESAGFRVELTMICHSTVDRCNESYSGRVVIKRAEEPLDIDRAAYCLTHPTVLRRLWFTHMQIADGVKDRMPGCGYPLNPKPGDLERGQLVVPGINTINPGSKDLKSPAAAAKAMAANMALVLADSEVVLPDLAFGGEGAE